MGAQVLPGEGRSPGRRAAPCAARDHRERSLRWPFSGERMPGAWRTARPARADPRVPPGGAERRGAAAAGSGEPALAAVARRRSLPRATSAVRPSAGAGSAGAGRPRAWRITRRPQRSDQYQGLKHPAFTDGIGPAIGASHHPGGTGNRRCRWWLAAMTDRPGGAIVKAWEQSGRGAR
jgi:hypothetical protein